MNAYQRIFGAGPRGLVLSLVLLALAWWLEPRVGLPAITASGTARWVVFGLGVAATGAVVLWSVTSLPPEARGKGLVTAGAFRYLRHPLYAAFLVFFDFGLAVLLNNWIYIVWAVLQHPLWHWNIRSEEALMRGLFPGDYDAYCRRTGRFIPRIGSLTRA